MALARRTKRIVAVVAAVLVVVLVGALGLAGNFLFGYSLDGKTESQYFARQAAHHILYTVVNSNAMNGYVHGVEYVGGFAYYKIILIVWDVLAAAGVGVLAFFIVKKVRRNLAAKKENN